MSGIARVILHECARCVHVRCVNACVCVIHGSEKRRYVPLEQAPGNFLFVQLSDICLRCTRNGNVLFLCGARIGLARVNLR